MKKKMIVASALLALVLVPQAFSAPKGYVKATLGVGNTYIASDVFGLGTRQDAILPELFTSLNGVNFAIKPAGGVEWKAGIFALALEASVGVGIGSDINYTDVSVKTVTPGIMGIGSLHLWKFVPYVGLGFAVPMVFSDDNVAFVKDVLDPDDFAYSFAADILVGFGFNITQNIMPTLEIEAVLGFGPYEIYDVQARLGCMVRFGG